MTKFAVLQTDFHCSVLLLRRAWIRTFILPFCFASAGGGERSFTHGQPQSTMRGEDKTSVGPGAVSSRVWTGIVGWGENPRPGADHWLIVLA